MTSFTLDDLAAIIARGHASASTPHEIAARRGAGRAAKKLARRRLKS